MMPSTTRAMVLMLAARRPMFPMLAPCAGGTPHACCVIVAGPSGMPVAAGAAAEPGMPDP